MNKGMDAPNWVKGKSNCDVDAAFYALAQVVERDVEEANRLPEQIRQWFSFSFRRSDTGVREQCVVTRKPADNSVGLFTVSVTFQKTEHSVKIDYVRQHGDERGGNDPSLEVVPKWDVDSATCTLEVAKKKVEAWQISQQALSQLFFNCH